jgi:hypothetical protein
MSLKCAGCLKTVPNSSGGADDHPEICAECWCIMERALPLMREKAIPMLLSCPCCGVRHIDKGVFAMRIHKSHACQSCGMVWRPAIEPTVGVQFLPGFKENSR